MGNRTSQIGREVRRKAGLLREYEIDSEARKEVIHELVAGEERYVEGLSTIVTEFMTPLAAKKSPLKAKYHSRIFSNLGAIYEMHREFLSTLKRISHNNSCAEIGSIILHSAERFREYTDYVNNCSTAQETLSKAMKKSKSVRVFIESKKSRLSALLMLPLERIPRYLTLLSALVEETPRKHPDYKAASQALEKVRQVADFLNEEKRIAENMQQLAEIESSLTGDYEIVSRHRHFVEEGEISKCVEEGEQKPCHYFLFNDLLLIAKKKSGSIFRLSSRPSTAWKLLYVGDLKEVRLSVGPESSFDYEVGEVKAQFTFPMPIDRDAFISDVADLRKKLPR